MISYWHGTHRCLNISLFDLSSQFQASQKPSKLAKSENSAIFEKLKIEKTCQTGEFLGINVFHASGGSCSTDFNKLLRVRIVENCSPSSLEKKEHLYIHKFKTLHPVGLNKINPFGLSRLCAA